MKYNAVESLNGRIFGCFLSLVWIIRWKLLEFMIDGNATLAIINQLLYSYVTRRLNAASDL